MRWRRPHSAVTAVNTRGDRTRLIPDFCSPSLSGCRSHPSRPPISVQSLPPIGGRLSAFSAEWTKIGTSQWVLRTLFGGVQPPLFQCSSSHFSHLSGILPESGEKEGPSRCSEGNGDERGERSRKDSFSEGFYSRLFLVPKAGGHGGSTSSVRPSRWRPMGHFSKPFKKGNGSPFWI